MQLIQLAPDSCSPVNRNKDVANHQRTEDQATMSGMRKVTDKTRASEQPRVAEKVCHRCEAVKPAVEFGYLASSRDKLHRFCRTCSREVQREYRAANPERTRQYRKDNYARHKDAILEKQRQQYAADPEPSRAQRRLYYQNNKEKVTAAQKAYYEKNKEKVRDYNLRYKYGISLEQRDRLLAAQGGVCAICQTSHAPDGKPHRWTVEHCHTSGAIRGCVCSQCNCILGYAYDNPDRLQAAIEYLKNPPARAVLGEPAPSDDAA